MKPPDIPDDEEARLRALEAYRVMDTAPEQAFDDLTTIAAAVFDAPMALVSLVDSTRQWFKSRVGLDATETSREVSFCGHIVASSETMVVGDATRDHRFADNPLVTGEPDLRFYAGAPLTTAEGHTLGTLCVLDRRPRQPNADQLRVLEALARQVVDQLELRAELRKRRMTESRMEAFFSLALDLLCVARSGYFVELNPAWERALGWTISELMDRPFIDFVHPEDRAPTIASLEQLSLRGGSRTIHFDNRYRRKDGSWVWLSWAAATDHDGSIYAIARDVTARRQVETMKSEFVSVVSHELRTPLTSIRGSLRLIEGGVAGELPERAVQLVGIALSNTERLIRLVNSILDLDKIEAGRLELNLSRVDLTRLLRAAIDDLRAFAQDRQVTIELDVDEVLHVDADSDRIQQVLVNLVSNAVKFSDAGGLVRVTQRRTDGAIRVEVIDRGPGIRAEDRERLFTKFEQLDQSDARSRGGTGLGLAITKAIVEQHGGRIGMESIVGRGSTFWFELSVAPQAVQSRTISATRDRARSVLVVEDDPDIATVLRELLISHGYRVRAVGSVHEAHVAFAQEAPDAAVIDVHLPDGSGLDLIRAMRESEPTSAIPVVVVTGSADQGLGLTDALLVDWLVKPFDPTQLLLSLRRATRREGPVKALVVDDDDDARQLLVEQLEHLGVSCVEAAGGALGVQVARRERPDLIVLDVGLPEIDGFDVVDLLRQNTLQSTPLIVYTGRELTSEERQRLELGVTRHLTKSYADEKTFAAAVTDLLADLIPAGG